MQDNLPEDLEDVIDSERTSIDDIEEDSAEDDYCAPIVHTTEDSDEEELEDSQNSNSAIDYIKELEKTFETTLLGLTDDNKNQTTQEEDDCVPIVHTTEDSDEEEVKDSQNSNGLKNDCKAIRQSCLPSIINEGNTTSKISAIDRLKDTNQNNMYDKFHERGQNIYNSKIVTYSANEQASGDIAFNEKRKYNTLISRGQSLLDAKININGLIRLWKYKDDFYFRYAKNSEHYKENKNYIAEIIRNFSGLNVRIVSQQEIAQNSAIKHNQIEDYIFTHQIPLIDKEVFDPNEKDFFQKDGIWYKNKFIPTNFLEKRFCNNIDSKDFHNCFIINFLENLVGEVEQDSYSKPRTRAIVSWLSRCFITMSGTHIALVLNGSQYIENIFWEKLIKPIFGNEEFCVIINDDTLKMPLCDIIKEKIFLKIEDFTPTNKNKQKIDELLKAVLVDKFLLAKTNPQQKIPVFAQAFITASETLSYMKKYHTLFEHINILDENKIISNLAENSIDLEIKFNDEKEIDIFTDCLAVFDKNNSARLQIASHFIQKDEEIFDNQLDTFIQAIKNKNKVYFKNVDDNAPIMYKELVFAFEKECFIGQDLSQYFNLVHGKEIFVSNINILTVLKEKDAMFAQELTIIKALNEDKQEEVLFKSIPTYKEVGNKKLYKINDYILAKDITVPRGWIITNREGNQRFKYNHEDIDLAKETYRQYDESKPNL